MRESPLKQSPGCRPTLFSAMSSVSTKSVMADRERRDNAAKLSIRIEPSTLRFQEFEIGKSYTGRLTVRNLTKKPVSISLDPPKSKFFQIAKHQVIDNIKILSGFYEFIDIEFNAPIEKDDVLYSDYLGVFVDGEPSHEVLLKAIPSGPQLKCPQGVDFGILFASENWVTRDFIITNNGKKAATVAINCNSHLSIKIATETSIIPPNSSITAKISFQPALSGTFNETGRFSITSSETHDPSVRLLSTAYSFYIRGQIIDHKLVFLNDQKVKWPSNVIDFGGLFYTQTKTINSILKNQFSLPLRWVMTYSGNNSPTRPPTQFGYKIEDSLKSNAAMQVIPNEGSLQPFEEFPVSFQFNPLCLVSKLGFKTKMLEYPKKEFSVSMQVSVLNELNNTSHNEPVEIILVGTAHPFLINITRNNVIFPLTLIGETQHEDFEIKNNSDILSCVFDIPNIANFKVIPKKAILKPGQNIKLKVLFKPNQVGELESKALINFYPMEAPLTKIFCLSTHSLDLRGSAKIEKNITAEYQSFHPNYDAHACFPNNFKSVEWKKKKDHQNYYTNLLKNLRIEKVQKLRDAYFGKEGVALNLENTSLKKSYTKIDKENGLTAPEPFDFSIFDASGQFMEVNSQEQDKQIRHLFEELKDTSAMDVKVIKLFPINDIPNIQLSENHQSLTATELSNIHLSAPAIVFGDVSLHAINTIEIKILNKNEKSLYFEFSPLEDSSQSSTNEMGLLKVFPSHCIVEPKSLMIIKIGLISHTAGEKSAVLMYHVNGRNSYQIPVSAKVKPAHIESSVECLSLDYKVENFVTDMMVREDAPKTMENYTPSIEKTFTLTNNESFPVNFSLNIEIQNDIKEELYAFVGLERYTGVFKLEPVQGQIAANSKTEIKIIYVPGILPLLEAQLNIQTIDKHDSTITECKSIKLSGSIGNTNITHQSTGKHALAIDFGNVPVFLLKSSKLKNSANTNANILALSEISIPLPYSVKDSSRQIKTVKLRNTAGHSCMFFASSTSSDIIINPSYGIIPEGNGSTDIHVSIIATKFGVADEVIVFDFLGSGKVLKIPVRFNGIFASVSGSRSEPNLIESSVILGSIGISEIIFGNSGPVSARIAVDFREYPDFKLKLVNEPNILKPPNTSSSSAFKKSSRISKKRETNSAKKEDRIILIDEEHKLYGIDSITTEGDFKEQRSSLYRNVSSLEESQTNGSNKAGALASLSTSKTAKGGLYLFEILPYESLALEVLFQPRSIRSWNFNLPIKLLNTDGLLKIPIQTKGVSSPLKISATAIDFKHFVLTNEQQNDSRESFTIQNEGNSVITWDLEIAPDASSAAIFKTLTKSGAINPGKNETLVVTFTPKSIGSFKANLMVHFNYKDIKTVFTIVLSGNGVDPCLAFDPPELYLPIAICGSTIMTSFSIINFGCIRTELTARIDNINSEQIEILFPEGRLLKKDGERMNAIIKINGSLSWHNTDPFPIGLFSKIEFSDTFGTKYYLPVYGTFDNSLFTLSSYLWSHSFESQFTLKDGDINSSISYETSGPKADLNLKRICCINDQQCYRTPCGISLDESSHLKEYETYLNITGKFVIKFVQECLGLSNTSESFPAPFAGNFKLLSQFTQFLSSKKVGINFIISGTDSLDRARSEFKPFAEYFTFLRSLGSMIEALKPEYLLTKSQYHAYMDAIASQRRQSLGPLAYQAYANYNASMEKHFSILSKEAWLHLILQIINLFVLQGITPKQLKTVAGVNSDESTFNWTMSKSNVYSMSENILLKWVSYHMIKQTGTVFRLVHFDQDKFKNSVAFAHLLKAHASDIVEKKLYLFNYNASQYEEALSNAEIILSCFTELFGKQTSLDISPQAIVNGNSVIISLVVAFLYQTLPQFLETTEITFEGSLYERIRKHIELTNNSHSPISYTATLSGCNGFSIDLTDTITVGAKSQIRLPVDFVGRHSKSTSAQLILRSSKMVFNNASILIFKLKSIVSAATPIKKYLVETPLYASLTVNVEIKNPFGIKGKFEVKMTQRLKNYRKSTKPTDEQEFEYILSEPHSPKSFILMQDEIQLDANGTSFIPVHFLPFETNVIHECVLYFNDDHAGEFMYQLDGRAGMPNISETISWSCRAATRSPKNIKISPGNSLREKALGNYFQVLSTCKAHHKEHISGFDRDVYQLPRNVFKFKIEYSSAFFIGPAEIVLKSEKKSDKKDGLVLEALQTELNVEFAPKVPGKYVCRMILSSIETPSDIRVFMIQGSAKSDESKTEVEFSAACKATVIQNLPIRNTTEEEWQLKSTFQGIGFTGPSLLTVSPGQTGLYPVSFCPKKMGDMSSILTLSHINSQSRYMFYLKGTGLEPLCESTKEIECKVRRRVFERVILTNPSEKDITYTVTFDYPYLSGPKTVTAISKKETPYEFEIKPRLSGLFQKSLTFTSVKEQSIVWYSLQINVSPSDAEGVIHLQTVQRTSTKKEIPLFNPTNEPILFNVDINGSGLSGEKTIRVNPQQEILYSLTYLPLCSGKSEGTVLFQCEQLGEFKYDLVLEADPSLPVVIPIMECAIGSFKSSMMTLRNPLDADTVFSVSFFKGTSFQLFSPPRSLITIDDRHKESTQKIKISSLGELQCQIVYWPESTTDSVSDSFTLSCNNAHKMDDQRFLLNGAPGTLPHVTFFKIFSEEDSSETKIVSILNPFSKQIGVQVSMADEKEESGVTVESQFLGNFMVDTLSILKVPVTYSNFGSIHSCSRDLIVDVGGIYKSRVSIIGGTKIEIDSIVKLSGRVGESSDCESDLILPTFENEALDDTVLCVDGAGVAIDTQEVMVEIKETEFIKDEGIRVLLNTNFSPRIYQQGISTAKILIQSATKQWRIPTQISTALPLPKYESKVESGSHVLISVSRSDIQGHFKAYFSDSNLTKKYTLTPKGGSFSGGDDAIVLNVGYNGLVESHALLVIESAKTCITWAIHGTINK